MLNTKLPIVLLVASLSGVTTLALADEDIPFDEAELFFELNNTDGDLGIHGKIDGDEWKRLEIEDVLRSHSGVQDCAVVGVPDVNWGDRVCAAVVSRPSSMLTADELRHGERYALAAWGISEKIRVARLRAGLSIRQLAAACQIDPAQLSRIETGSGASNVSLEGS